MTGQGGLAPGHAVVWGDITAILEGVNWFRELAQLAAGIMFETGTAGKVQFVNQTDFKAMAHY